MPTDPEIIKKYIGAGWWKHDLEAAEQLMLDAGMQKVDGTWALPDGSPFKVPLMSMNETNPTMNRLAAAVVENWKAFGIDTNLDAQASPWPIMVQRRVQREPGLDDRDLGRAPRPVLLPPVLALKVLRSQAAQTAAGSNSMRWKNPELDKIIESIQSIAFDDPEGRRIGHGFRQARRAGDADHPDHVV